MYDNPATPPPWYPSPPNPYGPPTQFAADAYRARLGWVPVLSLILSGLALIGVLGVAVLLVGGGGSAASLTGQVRSSAPHAALPGRDLGVALRDVLERDGDDVTTMTCPDTPRVDQGVVSVCHGSMDGDSYAFVVYFESDQGLFTLQPL